MLELMIRRYGALKDSSRIEFTGNSLKNISKELGYDDGQISRTLNPPHGKEISDESYKRVVQRLTIILENARLKKRESWILVTLALALIVLLANGYSILKRNESSLASNNPTIKEYRLTKAERHTFTDMYGELIQYKIALEIAIFHTSLKEGKYKGKEGYYLNELKGRIATIIEDTRKQLRRTNIRVENGKILSEIYKENSINNIGKGFAELKENLINTSISTSQLKDAVITKIEAIQTENGKLFDKASLAD